MPLRIIVVVALAACGAATPDPVASVPEGRPFLWSVTGPGTMRIDASEPLLGHLAEHRTAWITRLGDLAKEGRSSSSFPSASSSARPASSPASASWATPSRESEAQPPPAIETVNATLPTSMP